MFALYGAYVARLHGGANKIPKQVEAFLWALPQAYVASIATNNIVSVVVLVLTMLAMNTGHGQYFSFGRVWKRVKPERIDFMVEWFFGIDPRERIAEHHTDRPLVYDLLYFRCFFGMMIKGILRVLPCALALSLTPHISVLLIFGGALTAVAYALSHEIFEAHIATKYGEYLSGFFAFLTLGIVWAGMT